MKSRKFRDYVIPLILLLVQLRTLYIINTTNDAVNDDSRFYIGIGAVLLSIVVMRFNPRVGKLITLLILLAGILRLIVFTSTRKILFTDIFFGIECRFELLSFCLLILFTILHFRSLIRFIRSLSER
ncbi:hypothetical protein [Chitinophaga filiformis]|uniref:DUF4345 domain-containing protein n=1 Tax=Chitinophaga filiformis TaxID=104663 RepID=A0ABY4HTM7_CHIFI|nr:hypothetical protein [Chitinophaga filiformis]UPK67144.1 hypothetical protein MYF79_19585 [Chitinophaga filiformis]